MSLYVVERFLPGMSPEGLGVLAREQQGLDAADDVSYRHSTYVPADETCFCLFEAPSAQAVEAANARARLPFERVVEVVHVGAGAPERTGEALIGRPA